MARTANKKGLAETYTALVSWLNRSPTDLLTEILGSTSAYPYTDKKIAKGGALLERLESAAFIPVARWRSFIADAAARLKNEPLVAAMPVGEAGSDSVPHPHELGQRRLLQVIR